MANIVVRNGYNGFHRCNNGSFPSGKSNGRLSRASNKLPPINPSEHKVDINCAERVDSPFLQPSFSEQEDIVILLDHEVRRIRQLSVHLGISQHYEMAQYRNRFNQGRQAASLPKLDGAKVWRQSQKWIKRVEKAETDIKSLNIEQQPSMRKCLTSVDLNCLQSGKKKTLQPFNVPKLGCSYRLPALKKSGLNTAR